MQTIYLDYASATPLDSRVNEAMQPYLTDIFYNPSAIYQGGLKAKESLEYARKEVANIIGSKPNEITFTAGATESINLAIKGVMEQYPNAEILISSIEHEAVRKSAQNYKFKEIPVDGRAILDKDQLEKLISDNTVLISVIYANNEVGSLQPISDISRIIKQVRKDRIKRNIDMPLYLHTDSAQAPLYLDINVSRLGVDLMSLNGGKIYGPKQSGILYHRSGIVIKPQIVGGGQEYGMRSGTENTPACVGFAVALRIASEDRKILSERVKELSDFFISELNNRFRAELNGHSKNRLPNNVHVTFSGCDNERVLFSLDQQGIYASAGSACSASSDESSHVLRSMGMSDAQARSSVRFTLGRDTTMEEIERTIVALEIAIKA